MTTLITVRAVCVVHQLVPVPGRIGVSGIDKRPVAGPVPVHELGLRGDVQADRAHHGGEWKAVYLLSDEDVRQWEDEFGRPVEPGEFGENLRLGGADTTEWVIGTELGVGQSLRLRVTAPRVPCRTFAEHTGRDRWVRRFTEGGRPGAYARVLVPGPVEAGDQVRVLSVPRHGVTIGKVFAGVTPDEAARLLTEHDPADLAPSLLRKLDPATDVRPTDAS